MKYIIILGICLFTLIQCSKERKNLLKNSDQPPQLEIIGFEAERLTFVSGKKYLFKFIASDANGQKLDIAFKTDEKRGSVEVPKKYNDEEFSAYYLPLVKGDHTIEIIASNSVETVSKNLTVNFSVIPTAKFVFPNNSTAYQEINGKTITLNASGSKSGDGKAIQSFHWYLQYPDNRTLKIKELPSFIFDFKTYHPVGAYLIGLQVINHSGATSTTTWNQLDIKNSPPIAEFDFATKPTGGVNDVHIQVISNNSADPDPGDKINSYKWYVNGTHDSRYDNILMPEMWRVYVPPGGGSLSLAVTDKNGGRTSITKTFGKKF